MIMVHSLDRPAIPRPKFLRLDKVETIYGRAMIAALHWNAGYWIYDVELADGRCAARIHEAELSRC